MNEWLDLFYKISAPLTGYKIVDLQRSGRIALPKVGRQVPRLRAL